jgi:hypothetical protein
VAFGLQLKTDDQCDERYPICSRCERLGSACSLTLFRAPNDNKLVIMEQQRPTLIQLYQTATSDLLMGLTIDKTSPNLWRQYVLDLSSQHLFLYHAVLSLTALHSDLMYPSEKTALLALEHRNISLALLRKELSRLSKDNIDALFACQCIAVAYSIGSHGQAASLLAWKNMLMMLRATRVIVMGGGKSLTSGPFGKMIVDNPDFSEVPDEAESMLRGLTDRLDVSMSTRAYRQPFQKAIALLRMAISVVTKPDYDQISINSFMLMIDQEVLNLVFLGEPLALAIVGNYSACLHVVGQRNILIRHWGKELLADVQSRLPEDWLDTIAWAATEIGK